MKEILKELEFYPAFCRVKKTRSYYSKKRMTAAVDQVENLGSFLELEILVEKEADREKGLEEIKSVMKQIGCGEKKTVRTSYLSMIEKFST